MRNLWFQLASPSVTAIIGILSGAIEVLDSLPTIPK